MVEKVITVPDVGEAEGIELVEVLVSVGESVTQNQALVILESDKASVELPAAFDGVVLEVLMQPGSIVKEGDALMRIDKNASPAQATAIKEVEDQTEVIQPSEPLTADQDAQGAATPASVDPKAASQRRSQTREVKIPDLGQVEDAEVIEISCAIGDLITLDQVLILLESDKASLEITAEVTGTVTGIHLQIGDKVMGGEHAITMATEAPEAAISASERSVDEPFIQNKASAPSFVEVPDPAPAATTGPSRVGDLRPESTAPVADASKGREHAGPAVRKLAREFGVVLSQVAGSGPNARILKEDLHRFVKNRLSDSGERLGDPLSAKPLPDFSRFGAVEFESLPRLRKASARNLHRSWLAIPHVTHFDHADITDLESFRASLNQERGPDLTKISPLAFVIKAVVQTLKQYPRFNASLDPNFEHWVVKRFFNIGIAVETPNGLVVPNIKGADLLSVSALAEQASVLAAQARDKKLVPDAMQGTTFTISSLGGIGGTGFTPIVNSPEVAILGVARTQLEPRYIDGTLMPRKILPLALSYDHRAIDGAEAARFVAALARQLSDIRYLSV